MSGNNYHDSTYQKEKGAVQKKNFNFVLFSFSLLKKPQSSVERDIVKPAQTAEAAVSSWTLH